MHRALNYGCVTTSSGNISADQMFMMSNLCLLPSNRMICANITSAILGLYSELYLKLGASNGQ